MTDDELKRLFETIREENRTANEDTRRRSMIKFSYAELDRRIRTLEEGFADLQGRVERLETSTH